MFVCIFMHLYEKMQAVTGAGTVVGSLMGGSLADPCHQLGSGFPLCQPGQLLQRSPYFLPCATVGALSCFAAVIRSVMSNRSAPLW